jgi:flagellar biogenesis protein FliO
MSMLWMFMPMIIILLLVAGVAMLLAKTTRKRMTGAKKAR